VKYILNMRLESKSSREIHRISRKRGFGLAGEIFEIRG